MGARRGGVFGAGGRVNTSAAKADLRLVGDPSTEVLHHPKTSPGAGATVWRENVTLQNRMTILLFTLLVAALSFAAGLLGSLTGLGGGVVLVPLLT
ncbi:MAG: hypothetical protein WB817_10935, partial [Terriglobales bacterium]